jgi:hypothetical protein
VLDWLKTRGVVSPSGRVNGNWRRMLSPADLFYLESEMRKIGASSPREMIVVLGGKRGSCEICGKQTTFNRQDFFRFCSAKCSNGAESTMEARRVTNLKKFGAEHAAQSPVVKHRVAKELFEKYGNKPPHHFGGTYFKKRMTELYGETNPAKVKDIARKQAVTAHTRFTKRFLPELINSGFYTEVELLDAISKHRLTCAKCKTVTESRVWCGRTPRCLTCNPHNVSMQHKRVCDWLRGLGIPFIENDRTVLKPLEFDIYLPQVKLAIQINGLYWHSEEVGTDKHYHQLKTLGCLERGIALIHLYEDAINLNFEASTQRILDNYLRISNEEMTFEGVLEVDGSFPLPVQFGATLVDVSPPQPYIIDSRFRSLVKTPVWDSGKLFYVSKEQP